MRNVQKIQRFASSSFIFFFFTCLISNVTPKDTRRENYKGRRKETNQLAHFQIIAMDAKVLKDTSNHCQPCLLTKEAATPTEGVPTIHILLGTCDPSWDPAEPLQFPPGSSYHTVEGWAVNQKAWLPVPRSTQGSKGHKQGLQIPAEPAPSSSRIHWDISH